MADEFYKVPKADWKCGEEQTTGEGDTEYKWTPTCAWGAVQKFDWADFSGKDANEKEWAAKLTTQFGAGSQTQKATKDGDEVTTTAFRWTAKVATSGDAPNPPESTIWWSVADTGVEDADIANWKCKAQDLVAGADSAKAWNEDNEVAWAARPNDAKAAQNSIGGTCTSNNAEGDIVIADGSHWKVDSEIKYWFSAQPDGGKRAGNAAAQTFTVSTVSGAFTMTVAAGLVATAAVAF